ncbi:uncharacterized protein [Montipora foliosa]|uniref:uncharacterized protein n=1 Tax=Montipora foliosa TaxID=591990 RepID=UPI0035F1884B
MPDSSSSSSSSDENLAAEKEDVETNSRTEKETKKIRRRFKRIRGVWTFPTRHTKPAEGDEKDRTSVHSLPADEKKKKKRYARKTFPFKIGKSSDGSQGAHEEIVPDDSAVKEELGEVTLVTESETAELSGDGKNQNILSGFSDIDEKETLALLMTEAVLQAEVTEKTNVQEESAKLMETTGQDESDLVIEIPNPEGLIAEEEKKKPPEEEKSIENQDSDKTEKRISLKKELGSVNRVRYGIVSSLSQYKICVFVYDKLSLGKLIGWWSSVADLASNTARGIKLYILSSLIKKYPQCFKAQLKEIKSRSQKNTEVAKV